MIDQNILLQCRKWILERKANIGQVPGITEEKKTQYRALFTFSLYLLQWYGQQTNAGLASDNTGDAELYFKKENYLNTLKWLSDYYLAIAKVAEDGIKKSKKKEKEEHEETSLSAVAMLKIIDLFRRAQGA